MLAVEIQSLSKQSTPTIRRMCPDTPFPVPVYNSRPSIQSFVEVDESSDLSPTSRQFSHIPPPPPPPPHPSKDAVSLKEVVVNQKPPTGFKGRKISSTNADLQHFVDDRSRAASRDADLQQFVDGRSRRASRDAPRSSSAGRRASTKPSSNGHGTSSPFSASSSSSSPLSSSSSKLPPVMDKNASCSSLHPRNASTSKDWIRPASSGMRRLEAVVDAKQSQRLVDARSRVRTPERVKSAAVASAYDINAEPLERMVEERGKKGFVTRSDIELVRHSMIQKVK